MAAPTVSVLLPAYNAGAYLVPAVRSVLDAGYRDLELLLIDDGSTDGSVEALLAAVSDPRLVVVRQRNAGLSAALNRGIDEARGTYLARMDGDDQTIAGRFATQVALLEAHPDVVLVGGQIERMVDGRTESESRFPLGHDEIVAGLLQGQHVLCHPSVMMRTATARLVGGYWQHGVSEDWDLFLRLAEHGRLANVGERVLRYRFHSTGINASSMSTVRRNIRLAVENHHRRVAGEPELTPEQLWESLRPIGRFVVHMQTISLTRYRRALHARADGRLLAAGMGLLVAAVLWPQQAMHRVLPRLRLRPVLSVGAVQIISTVASPATVPIELPALQRFR